MTGLAPVAIFVALIGWIKGNDINTHFGYALAPLGLYAIFAAVVTLALGESS